VKLISNKATLRSYGYFLKEGLILFFVEKLIFPTMSKTIEFGKKITRNFRG
jgi:hypothetical protein